MSFWQRSGLGSGKRLLLCGMIGLLSMLAAVAVAQQISASASGKARSDCSESAAEVIVDLDVLEDRLNRTKAVGAFTKIKLKGEITKLLKKVEAYHDGKSSLTLEQIREQYDLLYMKVVSLLQAKDTQLHHQLCNSWDVIWTTLEDPVQFDKLSALERGADYVYF
jgi:hypothetical protein